MTNQGVVDAGQSREQLRIRQARRDERSCAVLKLPLPAPVAELARQRLMKDCPYAYYFKDLTFEFAAGVLTVRGRVATFFLKQMLQTWLRGLEGAQRIDNQVHVSSATGLSSEAATSS